MNMLNVGQSLNLNQKAGGTQKAGNRSEEVKDDFKNLLQGKNEESKEVTKDTAKEPEEGVQDIPGDESKKEEKVQTEGLLAAYQMSQNMRPEMYNQDPEVEAVSEVVASPETASVLEGEVKAPQAGTVQTVETQQPKTVQNDAQVKVEMATDTLTGPEKVEAADASTESEIKVFDLPKSTTKAQTKEEGRPQGENQEVQQTAAAVMSEGPVKTETQTAVTEETVTVQVRQPEELPEQVTEQILTKMADGVNEFEIHIEPENLGKIAVKISYQEGEANISILCSEKKAVEALGSNLKEICGVIERNFGGQTTVIVEKPDNDYLNQTRDDNGQGRQEAQQEQNKEGKKDQNEDDAEQFLQKLRLGLTGFAS